jgi:phosphate acetyltransferase/phosphate butyryltransferase
MTAPTSQGLRPVSADGLPGGMVALSPRIPIAPLSPVGSHPRLARLVEAARQRALDHRPAVGVVHPCDAPAMEAALRVTEAGIARPVLIGPRTAMQQAADAAHVDLDAFDVIATEQPDGKASAARAVRAVHDGVVGSLMKGSLHTDELMSAVVQREGGLRGARRISHVFLFDLPRYPKLLALADCVVNITPDLKTKRDILANALDLLRALGVMRPKVAAVAAIETVNPQITATTDAKALVDEAAHGAFGPVLMEGPFGFDNAISAEAARIKRMDSQVAGDADLMLMPDLNAGNMLYKSFNYIGGGDSAGLVLGAQVPIVLTSRADSQAARLASVALAVLVAPLLRAGDGAH